MSAIPELKTDYTRDPLVRMWKDHKGKVLAAGAITLTALVAYWYFSSGAAFAVVDTIPKSTALTVVKPPIVSNPVCPIPPICQIDKDKELRDLFNLSSPTNYQAPSFAQTLASHIAKYLKIGVSTAGTSVASLANLTPSLPSLLPAKLSGENVSLPPAPTNSTSPTDWLPTISWPSLQFDTTFRTARIFTALTIFVLGQNNMLPQRMLDPLFR